MSLESPDYIEASSAQALREKMLTIQIKDGYRYQFTSIVKDGKKWIAWFTRVWTKEELFKQGIIK